MRVSAHFFLPFAELLLLLLIPCCPALCQQKPRPVVSFRDLEAGMPRGPVLATLAQRYKPEEEMAPPPDPSKGYDAWTVFSDKVYAGEIVFRNGKLWLATLRLYSPGDGDAELADQMFRAILESSGQSVILRDPTGDLTRTRDTQAILETKEENDGKLRTRTINFLIGQKMFALTLQRGTDTRASYVTFDAVVVHPN